MQGTTWKEKAKIPFKPGELITGKWNNKKYYVIKELGSGMIGTVYLCRENGNDVALKISKQSMSMTTEVNVLKSLDKIEGRLAPRLLDVDDWQVNEREVYSFYVMEYIRGKNINEFINRNGSEWVGIFLLQLLDQLGRLHESGWIFGDLKNENLIVEQHSSTIRLIDVGGTTKQGRSVKEYTAFHDRAYWNLGSRKAEPSYDLFALVMVILKVYYPQELKVRNHAAKFLKQKITDVDVLQLYATSLEKAITGKYQVASEMRNDIMQRLIYLNLPNTRRKNRLKKRVFECFLILTVTGMYGATIYYLF